MKTAIRRTMLVLLLAGPVVAGPLVAGPAAAAPGSDPEYDSCISRSDGTNAAWAECGSALVARKDAALNADWKKVYGGMEAASKAALLEEQRAWIAYKDKACRLYQTSDWGREGQVLSFPACLARVIEARRRDLKDYGSEGNR